MEMIVHLDSDVFEIVRNGEKTVEARVNDLKRQKIKVGDTLVFLKRPNNIVSIKAKVIKLDYFADFDDLGNNYEMRRLYLPSYTKKMWLNLMERFYSKEE